MACTMAHRNRARTVRLLDGSIEIIVTLKDFVSFCETARIFFYLIIVVRGN